VSGICPCCGQSVQDGERLIVSLDANACSRMGTVVRLSRYQAVILHMLAESHPKPVLHDRLIMGVYGAAGGPPGDSNSFAVQITKLRRTVEHIGVRIENVHALGYRLRFAEPKASYGEAA
jgi:DNA-binding response OmpR family regulator